MFGIVLDGFVLLGLMYVFDRKNPSRDFLETGLVAFLLTIAGWLLRSFVSPHLGDWVTLLVYTGICYLLLWKMTEIDAPRSGMITVVFVALKIAEPYIFAFLGISLNAGRWVG